MDVYAYNSDRDIIIIIIAISIIVITITIIIIIIVLWSGMGNVLRCDTVYYPNIKATKSDYYVLTTA